MIYKVDRSSNIIIYCLVALARLFSMQFYNNSALFQILETEQAAAETDPTK